MLFSANRPLFKALGVSVMLHLALLLGVVNFYPVELDAPSVPLRVGSVVSVVSVVIGPGEKIRGTPLASAATERIASDTTRSALPLTASDSNWSLPAPARRTVPRPVAEPKQVLLSAAANGAPSTSAFKSGDIGAADTAGTADTAGRAGTAVVAREGVSADAMRQYRMSLASAARRFKRYPPLARAHGWEGTVEVALNVNARLAVPEVVLMRSSGRDLLDEQALTMVAQAVRLTPLPEGLQGRDFRVLLPVRFSLEESR